MSSLTRSAIGCEKESRIPGILPSSSCRAATSSGLVLTRGPLLAGLEHDQQIGLLRPHGILGDLGTSRLADNRGHLGEVLAQSTFHEAADADRPLERGVGQPHDVDRDRPFVQVRDELGPDPRGGKSGGDEGGGRKRERHPAGFAGAIEQGQVAAVHGLDDAEFLLRNLLQQQSRDHRHDGQRHDQRDEDRDDHRRRQRGEHFPLDPLQRKEGDHHDHDDQHRKTHGPRHFADRLDGDVPAQTRVAPLAEVAAHVFDDDDRGVHDHADRKRQSAEAHQIRGDPGAAHDQKRHEEGDRQRGDDDERRAQLRDEEKEDQDHEDAALEQGVDDGLDAGFDQGGPVVEDVEGHPGRQALLDPGHGLLDAGHHVFGVRPPEHDHHAGDGLTLAVAGDRALAGLRADDDFGDVVDVHRRPCGDLEHDLADILDPGDLPEAADVGLLPAAHDESAGGVGIVPLQRLHDVPQAEVVFDQRFGAHEHVILLDEAPEAVDLVHAGDRAQLRRHEKVLNPAQFHRRERRALERVLEDFPQSGAGRTQFRLRAGRELFLRPLDPLEDLLAREVDVGVVFEDHDHLREAGFGERADLGHPGHAAHLLLDRVGDLLLDVGCREPGGLGQDHDLDVRDVGKGVDRQPCPADPAGNAQQQGGGDDEPALPQENGDEGVHGLSPLVGAAGAHLRAQDV